MEEGMGNTYTLYVRSGETIDETEDRFFSEHPELLSRVDLTLFIIDLDGDFLED